MRTFIIILFVFFLLFLMGSLFIIDPLILFIVIFLAFLIAIICLVYYLGYLRGALILVAFVFLPFFLEYLFYRFNLPFFQSPLIRILNLQQLNLAITLNNLFLVFSLPLLFMTALIFSHKIKLFANIKRFHNTFITINASILVSLSFLLITPTSIEYQNFLKWLVIALIINFLLARFYQFKAEIPEIYKELPIILYLAIYGTSALKQLNTFNLIVTVLLTLFYLLILYNEYKIRKIS